MTTTRIAQRPSFDLPMRVGRGIEVVAVQQDMQVDAHLVTLRVYDYRAMPASFVERICAHAQWSPYVTESHARRGRTAPHSRR